MHSLLAANIACLEQGIDLLNRLPVATRFGLTEFPPGFGIAPSTIHHLERKGA